MDCELLLQTLFGADELDVQIRANGHGASQDEVTFVGTIKSPDPYRRTLLSLSQGQPLPGDSLEAQASLLENLYKALCLPTDVARFLCLHAHDAHPSARDKARLHHDAIVRALLRIYDRHAHQHPRHDRVAVAALKALGRLCSAGVSVRNVKEILRRAASAKDRGSARDLYHQKHLLTALTSAGRDHLAVDRGSVEEVGKGGAVELRQAAGVRVSGYFSFGGRGSGLRMSALSKWPFGSEYGIWCWLRMEEHCGRFEIFSMRTGNGDHGVDFSLVGDDLIGYNLIARAADERGRSEARVKIGATVLASRRWNHILITHAPKRFRLGLGVGLGTLRVVVNGEDVSQAGAQKSDAFQLHFPTKIKAPLAQVSVLADFDGQAGPVFVLKEAVSIAQVNALAKLYLRNRGGHWTGRAVAGVTGLEVGEVDKTLELKVFACLHPFHCVGDLAMDLYAGHHALMEPNTCPWTLPSLQDALVGAGGVKALVPFLWHGLGEGGEETNAGGECVVEATRLLAVAIESHLHSATAFADLDAPALISSALEQSSRKILSAVARPLLFAIAELIDVAGHWRKFQGVFSSPRKIDSAVEVALYKHLLFNFPLWAQCESGTSSRATTALFDILDARMASFPELFRGKIGLLHLLDPLRRLFTRCFSQEADPEPNLEAICEIYANRVQQLACNMLQDEILPSELNMLLCPILGVAGRLEAKASRPGEEEVEVEAEAKWEPWAVKLCETILKVLLHLLTEQPPPRYLFNSAATIADGFGLPVVLIGVTLKAPSDRVKLLALKALSAYLTRVDESSRIKPKVDSGSFLENEADSGEAGTGGKGSFDDGEGHGAPLTMEDIAVMGLGEYSSGILRIRHSSTVASASLAATSLSSIGGFSCLCTQLQSAPSLLQSDLSRHVYEAILPMFLRRNSGKEEVVEEYDSGDAGSCEAMDDSQTICNVDALWLLLNLLPQMNHKVVQHSLQVIFLVLGYQTANIRAILQVPRWQYHLIAVLRRFSQPSLATSSTCFDITAKLISSVLSHLFHSATQGWRQVEVLLSMREDNQDTLISQVLYTFFTSLDAQLASGNQPAKLLVSNLAQTLGVVASYLLSQPSLAELTEDHPHLRLLSALLKLLCTLLTLHGQSKAQLLAERPMYCPAEVATVHLLLLQMRGNGTDSQTLTVLSWALPLLDNDANEVESRGRCLLSAEAFLVGMNILLQDWSNRALEQLLVSRKDALLNRLVALQIEDDVLPAVRKAAEELSHRAGEVGEELYPSAPEVDRLVAYFEESMEGQRAAQERVAGRQASARRKRMDVLAFHARVMESELGTKEMERESSTRVRERRQERECVRKWQELVLEGANASSIWDVGDEKEEQFWMLSEKEDKLRRRLLLRRNYNYDNHAKAAWDSEAPSEGGGDSSDSTRGRRRSGRFLQELEEWATADAAADLQGEGHFVLKEGEALTHVSENTQWITPLQVVRGRVEVSSQSIYFYPTARELVRHSAPFAKQEAVGAAESARVLIQENVNMMRWKLEDVVEIHGRRYLLRPAALELFFSNLTNILLCFASPEDCQMCYDAILKQNTPRLEKTFRTIPTAKQVFELSGVMGKWRKREVSNFEYIMRLNTIAGRSMNDLTQYPVFPWILSDYTSQRLDFSREEVFRDLSKPMGALNPARLKKEFIPKYKLLEDAGGFPPPHHYGSHYSLPGSITQYMLRVEPFTTLHVDLQSGKFDSPDRLFFSILSCWRGCNDNPQDLKELIPEFFYFPELFINTNKLNLGLRSNEEVIDDVKLPPWASSPHEFVRLNREALESEYVSQNLHHWIDLIFGHKQRGDAAKEAFNVFYYVTYEGMVDLDAIEDPVQRKAMEDQINLYGQTPSQLLLDPHPPRLPPHKCSLTFLDNIRSKGFTLHSHNLWTDPYNYNKPRGSALTSMLPTFIAQSSSDRIALGGHGAPSLVYVCPFEDRVVTVFEDLSFGVHRLVSPQVIKAGQVKVLPSAPISLSLRAHPHDRHLLNSAIASAMKVTSGSFACAKSGKLVLSSTYFDCSIRAHHVDSVRVEDGAVGHVDVVNCLALGEDGISLVSGGKDCAIVVWNVVGSNDVRDETMDILGTPDLGPRRNSSGGSSKSFLVDLGLSTENHILSFARKICAHDAPITALVVSGTLGIIVSGSSNGRVFIHQLHDGSFIRSLFTDSDDTLPVTDIMFAPISGSIVTIRASVHVHVFSVNGYLLMEKTFEHPITASCIIYKNSGKECLVVGYESGVIGLYRVHDLVLLEEITAAEEFGRIEYLAIGKDNCTLFVASTCGLLHTIVPA